MESELERYSYMPYTMQQWNMGETVDDVLHKYSYERLFGAESEEIIPYIPMPEDNLFGKRMKLETSLFRDVWELLPF